MLSPYEMLFGEYNPNGYWQQTNNRMRQLVTNPSGFFSDWYSDVRYGTVPAPAGGKLAAPQTRPQMTQPGQWTPEQAGSEGLQQQTGETQQRIAQAEADGTYTPNAWELPKLPTVDDTGIVIAALVVGGVALWSLRK